MFDHSRFMLFLAASTALILTPGPSVLYIVARGIGQGRLAGIVSVLGVGVGNFTHAVAVTAGLSAVIASSALAFTALKYIGAFYLIYLGLKKFVSNVPVIGGARFAQEPLSNIFRQGLLVGILNPKTALFFLSFIPQFVEPRLGSAWIQLLLLGFIFVMIAIFSDSVYALLSGTFGMWFQRHSSFLKSEKYISGTIYCGLGIAMAVSTVTCPYDNV